MPWQRSGARRKAVMVNWVALVFWLALVWAAVLAGAHFGGKI